jgi:cyclophilin family peptidyl-prolyl cis-trans isomerase
MTSFLFAALLLTPAAPLSRRQLASLAGPGSAAPPSRSPATPTTTETPPLTRRQLALLAAGASASLPLRSLAAPVAAKRAPAAAKRAPTAPRVTQRAYIDLRIIESYTLSDVLENSALRGRLTLGLYGEAAPLQTARFIELLTGRRGGPKGEPDSFPSLASANFEKRRPAQLLLSGSVPGVDEIRLPDSLGGGVQYEWGGLNVALRPVLESVRLSHDRRGLLTHRVLSGGTQFGITLAAAPELDRDWAVFGEVLVGAEPLGLLAEVEALPFLTGEAAPESATGQVGAAVYSAQRTAIGALSQALGDNRVDERVGKLLRRVEIVSAGLL